MRIIWELSPWGARIHPRVLVSETKCFVTVLRQGIVNDGPTDKTEKVSRDKFFDSHEEAKAALVAGEERNVAEKERSLAYARNELNRVLWITKPDIPEWMIERVGADHA